MDTSEEYIKMCDCPEIQGEWTSSFGDWFLYERDEEIAGVDIFIIGCQDDAEKCKQEGVDDTWLPRQDQIQEMIAWGKDFKAPIKIRLFHSWIFKDSNRTAYCQQFDSLEKVWLAFYMSEKHSKFWGKDGWKINE